MRNYRDLEVWQKAHALTLEVYKATADFPKGELYGLTSQIRRACVSIEANLAEGCGRRGGEFARFVQMAMGSASELDCHLLIAKDLGFLADDLYVHLQRELSRVRRMLTGLYDAIIASTEKEKSAKTRAAAGG